MDEEGRRAIVLAAHALGLVVVIGWRLGEDAAGFLPAALVGFAMAMWALSHRVLRPLLWAPLWTGAVGLAVAPSSWVLALGLVGIVLADVSRRRATSPAMCHAAPAIALLVPVAALVGRATDAPWASALDTDAVVWLAAGWVVAMAAADTLGLLGTPRALPLERQVPLLLVATTAVVLLLVRGLGFSGMVLVIALAGVAIALDVRANAQSARLARSGAALLSLFVPLALLLLGGLGKVEIVSPVRTVAMGLVLVAAAAVLWAASRGLAALWLMVGSNDVPATLMVAFLLVSALILPVLEPLVLAWPAIRMVFLLPLVFAPLGIARAALTGGRGTLWLIGWAATGPVLALLN